MRDNFFPPTSYIYMEILDRPLADDDLKKLCLEMHERANIVIVDGPVDFGNAFKSSGHCIFWVPNQDSKVGHWIGCVRKPDRTCFFFDSYGRSPENWKYLGAMFQKSNLDYVEYNKTMFQSINTNTCGKYAIVVIALNKLGLSYADIENFFLEHQPCDKFLLKLFE